ncbi:Hypothetical predicted protein [Octopus vulgaris]|uniref:Uncharacterized protein n=1 Tax=Octopus vulgaris TaxID=6645 RepID=A0AA36AZH2_OCTVU|nr:Hypothetical predicted protein [Octopus vulgaris]
MTVLAIDNRHTVPGVQLKSSYETPTTQKRIADMQQYNNDNNNDNTVSGGKRTLYKLLRQKNKYKPQLWPRVQIGKETGHLQNFNTRLESGNRHKFERDFFKRVKRSYQETDTLGPDTGSEFQTGPMGIRIPVTIVSGVTGCFKSSGTKTSTVLPLFVTRNRDQTQQDIWQTTSDKPAKRQTMRPGEFQTQEPTDVVAHNSVFSTHPTTMSRSSQQNRNSSDVCFIPIDATFVDPSRTLYIFSGE